MGCLGKVPPNEIQLGEASALTQEGKNNHKDRDGFNGGRAQKWRPAERDTAPERYTN